jgi:hypothetical protein
VKYHGSLFSFYFLIYEKVVFMKNVDLEISDELKTFSLLLFINTRLSGYVPVYVGTGCNL